MYCGKGKGNIYTLVYGNLKYWHVKNKYLRTVELVIQSGIIGRGISGKLQALQKYNVP